MHFLSVVPFGQILSSHTVANHHYSKLGRGTTTRMSYYNQYNNVNNKEVHIKNNNLNQRQQQKL